MANYGSDDVAISVDNSGGTPVDLTAYITTFNGVNIRSLTEDTTPFGVAWAQHKFTGMNEGDNFTIGGVYDDTSSSGPDAVLNARGATRTVTITWGGSKTTSGEANIIRYTRTTVRKELVKYECELQWTGTVTEA